MLGLALPAHSPASSHPTPASPPTALPYSHPPSLNEAHSHPHSHEAAMAADSRAPRRRVDVVVVESTGVGDTGELAEGLEALRPELAAAGLALRLVSVVLVDAAAFLAALAIRARPGGGEGAGKAAGVEEEQGEAGCARPLGALLARQVEAADVVLLNKVRLW
jgi:G3E family GTPase